MEALINILIAKGWTPGATGIWFLVALVGGMFLREWRETRKLSAEDRLARREGYAAQVESLMRENRALRGDLRTLREEYDRYRQLCHEETDQLHAEVRRMEAIIVGLERQFKAQAQSLPRVIEDKIKTTPRTLEQRKLS